MDYVTPVQPEVVQRGLDMLGAPEWLVTAEVCNTIKFREGLNSLATSLWD